VFETTLEIVAYAVFKQQFKDSNTLEYIKKIYSSDIFPDSGHFLHEFKMKKTTETKTKKGKVLKETAYISVNKPSELITLRPCEKPIVQKLFDRPWIEYTEQVSILNDILDKTKGSFNFSDISTCLEKLEKITEWQKRLSTMLKKQLRPRMRLIPLKDGKVQFKELAERLSTQELNSNKIVTEKISLAQIVDGFSKEVWLYLTKREESPLEVVNINMLNNSERVSDIVSLAILDYLSSFKTQI